MHLRTVDPANLTEELPDARACYQILVSHDARFDGHLFVGVKSTGVYCRPVCRVRLPKQENCQFFRLAAQAEGSGFRPCLRCRPELAPARRWSMTDANQTLVQQALQLLGDHMSWGASDGSPEALAARMGISSRHLRRLFESELGISPLQAIQTRRLLCAKQLLADTTMDIAQVAMASGFGSVRGFNAAFRTHYRMRPKDVRRLRAKSELVKPDLQPGPLDDGCVYVRLAYRPPYDVDALLAFLRQRNIPAIESIDVKARRIVRTHAVRLPGSAAQGRSAVLKGWIQADFEPSAPVVNLRVSGHLSAVLPQIITQVRQWLDLDADPLTIHSALESHFPNGCGMRLPGGLDGFELAVRAVLGQQVTVAAARTMADRLVQRFGEALDDSDEPQRFAGTTAESAFPSRLFPSPAALAKANPDALGELGIVRTRQAAILALARAMVDGSVDLRGSDDVQTTIQTLKAMPGIGDWTAQYIAMRALRWPDAFPASDVALHRAFGYPKTWSAGRAAKAAEASSQAWRPWRAYAVMRAWSVAADSPTQKRQP
jgi:AraC family transcriptional regulator, regulatory protein of adaptative response / DNA-3-methyladenine glycosylase II